MRNQKSFYYHLHSQLKQTFRLHINKTLSKQQEFTPRWKAVHTTLLLYDRLTSELITTNDENWNPLVCVLRSDCPIIVQKRNYRITKTMAVSS